MNDTRPSLSRKFTVGLALASMLFAGTLHAQTTTATVPVGVMTYTLTGGGTNNAIGIPLVDTEVFSGPSSAVTANTISVSSTPWTAGAFATAAAPYFVTILSGSQTGRTLLITANTSNTVTVAVDDTNLNAAGFAMAAGDRFEIVPGETLGTFFGSTAGTVILTGNSLPFLADTVQVHNGAKFVSYYFNSNFWTAVGGDGSSANNVVLYPDRAVMVLRRGSSTSFTVTGRAPSTQLLTKLPGSGSTSAITTRFPVDTTLASLNFTGPGTWTTNNLAFLANTVSLWNGAKWVSYWQNTSGTWLQVGGDGSDKGTTPIAAGTPLLILNRGAASGSTSFYSQALPYSLN